MQRTNTHFTHLPSRYILLVSLTHVMLSLAHLHICSPIMCPVATSYFSALPTSDGWNLHIHSPLICRIATSCLFVSPISDGWCLHISSYFSSDSQFVMCWYRECAHCRWGKGAEHRLQLPLFPRSRSSVGFSKVLCLLYCHNTAGRVAQDTSDVQLFNFDMKL
jgi:hypothetical protein